MAERIIVKVGTSSLVAGGRVDPDRAAVLVEEVAGLVRAGLQPVLVASGAIALGRAVGAEQRQLAAALGQGPFFEALRTRLADHELTAAQFLLTPVDLVDPRHHPGVRATLEHALDKGVIPVVNENDAVRVRNNDILAALLSALLRARMLVLLTDVPGLYDKDPRTAPDARLIPEIKGMTVEVERLAGATGSGPGTGGMVSKLGAVWIATTAGASAAIVGAHQPGALPRLLRGESVGTIVHPRSTVPGYGLERLWLAFGEPPAGTVVCLPGTRRLVAADEPVPREAVIRTAGRFTEGDVVDLAVPGGEVIARGRIRRTAVPPSEYVSFLEAS
ncbi:glutamate 5-kinase [Catenulispora subtropica]|uniref:Glutamate 5-kinase n=1 Tax=Catenulispora subtropica TaxID=450798 RepID=A0ABP5DNA2_9ACTN